ncbi:MAG: class I tRNA ligase family protein [Anaerolineales bacterium]
MERNFQNFQYGQAGQQIHDFIYPILPIGMWRSKKKQMKNEATKTQTVETLARVFDTCLRLLHPFTPFVTEEIWGHLRSSILQSSISPLAGDWPHALIVAKFPHQSQSEEWDDARTKNFALFQDVVRAIRNQRAEKNVKPNQKLMSILVVGANRVELYKSLQQDLATLAGLDMNRTLILDKRKFLEKENIHLEFESIEGYITLVVNSTDGAIEIFLPLAELGNPMEDKSRLEKELKEAESHIERLEKLLSSDFANKAPAALVQKERDKLAGYKDTAEKIKAQLK